MTDADVRRPADHSLPRFMYHCFPRRAGTDTGRKGLEILRLIVEHGLLLTPEIEHWVDSKTPPSPPEEYVAIARRCCFTELAEHELPKHAEYFGQFGLEFDTRVLCDLGAMPVFYVPRTSNSNGYGVGPALVTQLAHVQDMLGRLTAFRAFSKSGGSTNSSAQIVAYPSADGGLILAIAGTTLTLTIPSDVVERAKKMNPSFSPPDIPTGGAPLGVTAGTLESIFNVLNWGLHEPDVLTGTVKALGSLFYSTERPDDPFLSHYQQREWRIIGGIKKDNVGVMQPISPELRKRLFDLDESFFGRELQFPTGNRHLADECEVFSHDAAGRRVLSLVRRIICPAHLRAQAESLLRAAGVTAEVVKIEGIGRA